MAFAGDIDRRTFALGQASRSSTRTTPAPTTTVKPVARKVKPRPKPKAKPKLKPARKYSSTARQATSHKPPAHHTTVKAPALPRGNIRAVLAYAYSKVGDWYRFGSAGPNTFDCSGLAMMAYARIGIRLPHKAAAMMGYGRRVSRADLQPGDLVFPDSHHVQIYVGGGKIVEAPRTGERVVVRAMWGFMTARRLT